MTGTTPNATSCSAAKYAGCMTAPCHHTGKFDAAGNELVQCQCPVYDGPFELGQAGVPCDANALTPPAAATTGKKPFYVWSAAHNPIDEFELRDAFCRASADLKERELFVVVKREIEGFSNMELAEAFDVTEGRASQLRGAALEQMREQIGDSFLDAA